MASTIRASFQLMISMKKIAVTMFISAPGDVQQPPGHQLGDAVRIGGHAGHDPAHRRPVKVGEGQVLQVVEHLLAQVVADALAQDAGQVDKAKDADGLDDDQRSRRG